MKKTRHGMQRMSQRGISQAMVELVMQYGEPNQDEVVLGRRQAERLLKQRQEEMKVLKKVLDKGGLVVVANDDTVITTYNSYQY